MREIKFRVWLKDKMEMCEVLMINFQKSYIGVKTKDYNIIQVGISWKYTQKVVRFDDVELMQYTGLKDKNGKEICEGDIVDCNGDIGTVVIDDGATIIYRTINEVPQMSLLLNVAYKCKIIGNIYENSELLEVE